MWRRLFSEKLIDRFYCLFAIRISRQTTFDCDAAAAALCTYFIWFIFDVNDLYPWHHGRGWERKCEINEGRARATTQSRSGDWSGGSIGCETKRNGRRRTIGKATNTYHKMYDCPNRFISGRLCRKSKARAKRTNGKKEKWLFGRW